MYKIKDWNKHFENNRTRELRELRFVIVPNKQDGDGYTELLDHPNGPAHYAAWISLLAIASKGEHPPPQCGNPAGCCECRGSLMRNGGTPHDPASLSRLTRIPRETFQEALPRLVSIGWLEQETSINQQDTTAPSLFPQPVAPIPHPPAETRDSYKNGTEQNRTEQKKEKTSKPRDARLDHPALQAVRNIKGKFPNKDVWDVIITTLGDDFNADRLKQSWVAWRAKNYSPENLSWLLDWYVNGIPTNGARPGQQSNVERNIEVGRRLIAEKEAEIARRRTGN